jgi:hypothetical protein
MELIMEENKKDELFCEKVKRTEIEVEIIAKVVKIALDEDTYRKIKSFAILLGINEKEPILLGNAISKLYEIAKEKIYTDYI